MAITKESALPEAVVADPIAAVRQAWMSGSDPEAAVYGATEEPASPSPEDIPQPAQAEISVAAEVETSSSEPTPESSSDLETVYIRDSKGQKQKLEISYSDRQKVKEAFLKAAGMRKFQAERDNHKKALSEMEKKYQELQSNFGRLEQVFKDKGARGLFEVLGGGPDAWNKAVEEELKARERLAGMTPEERLQLSMQEREKSYQAEKSELEQKYNQMLQKIEQEQEQAAVRSLESRLVPAFERYRFKGKLGDDVAEHEIDEAVWSKVTSRLAEYPEDVEITQALIDKEFRSVSNVYRKVLDKQADSKLKQAVSKQKENAAQRAQLAVKKATTSHQLEQSVAADIENSNWSSLLQKAFSGRLKL